MNKAAVANAPGYAKVTAIMMRSRLYVLNRWILALMLLTFLSPGFGWQMVADHGQLAHIFLADVSHDHHDSHDHAADFLNVDHAVHEHEDAHSMIGHVLGHMPFTIPDTMTAKPQSQPSTPGFWVAPAVPDAPPRTVFRPPTV